MIKYFLESAFPSIDLRMPTQEIELPEMQGVFPERPRRFTEELADREMRPETMTAKKFFKFQEGE